MASTHNVFFKKILDNYTNKNVLITGGLGFIGSNLAHVLDASGARVTIVDSLVPEYGGNLFNIRALKGKVHLNICDVRDPYALTYLLKDQHYLFNLAGQTSHIDSMIDPQTDLQINLVAQLSLLETCRKFNPDIKIVFASTRQIYGQPDYLPVDEKHPVRPVDVNGINKLAGEQYHMLYNNVHGLRACALRLTNTYGPRMRIKDSRQTFLGIWVRLILERKRFEIFGDGQQLRDFNYIDDCIDALLLAGSTNASNGKVYNLGSNEVISLQKLANLLVAAKTEGEYDLIEFPKERKVIDIGDYYGDFSLIQKELGWSPKIGMAEGLNRTLEYYRTNLNHYV